MPDFWLSFGTRGSYFGYEGAIYETKAEHIILSFAFTNTFSDDVTKIEGYKSILSKTGYAPFTYWRMEF